MPESPLADAAARTQIREALDTTFVVEAAAGTGKTTELVARIVALVQSGRARLAGVVAVTFTEKAAGEMKLRLRAGLEQARLEAEQGSPARDRFDQALRELELAHIGTIHAFCAELLRARPVEAVVDPDFEVVTEAESRRIFDAAFSAWFERILEDPPEGVRRFLHRPFRAREQGGRVEALAGAAWELTGQRDFTGAWTRKPFDRAHRLGEVVEILARTGQRAQDCPDEENTLRQSLALIRDFIEELRRHEATHGRDDDFVEAALCSLSADNARTWDRKRGRGNKYGHLERKSVLVERDAALEALNLLIADADADLAACLHDELRGATEAYEQRKARAAQLDFVDLLARTRDLLKRDATVRGSLQARFTHIFVDEFQDTDPLQAEILLLLAADTPHQDDAQHVRPVPGKLFVVGDPKQSIYRFRRADIALYQRVKAQLVACGAERLYLTTSFRGAPSIQEAINAAFSRTMTGGAQAEYVPLDAHRADPTGQPTVIALPVPGLAEGHGKVTKAVVEASLPSAVAALIAYLVHESGWHVTERGRGERVPLEARHIGLLFKRFQSWDQDVTRAYAQALEAHQIPHVLVGGRTYHARGEVLAARTALSAIEWPDDELSVYATLVGPLFAFQDAALLEYRQRYRRLHPLAPAPEGGDAQNRDDVEGAIFSALELLGELHRGRNRRPIADTIAQLLEGTRAHAGIAFGRGGEQALANVLRLMDAARSFEAKGASSFRAFVERQAAEAERGELGDAPVIEEGSDGVRMTTVHRAKGLEFPVVILVDPCAPAALAKPTRWYDPDRNLCAIPLAGLVPTELREHAEEAHARNLEESTRLTYVAATRARDLLVVPVAADGGELDGWTKVLSVALHPAPDARRRPLSAPGCPTFARRLDADGAPTEYEGGEPIVAPGLHVPQAGKHSVVWWDPELLAGRPTARAPENEALAVEATTAAELGESLEASKAVHRAWRAAREETLARGSRPTCSVLRVTEVPSVGGGTVPVRIERTDGVREGRPGGRRFGTLVHGLIAVADLDSERPALESLAQAVARTVGASPEETAAAVEAVQSALRHPLLLRARNSAARGEVRKEEPVLHRSADGGLADGVVDLAFREHTTDGGRWTVVDFKTDAELVAQAGRYERQVQLYAQAIAAATGEPAQAVLLLV